jgi:P4 family phage/plasmid primase-like protien
MTKKTNFTEVGSPLLSAASPEIGRDYLEARDWSTAAIKAFRFRWIDSDDLLRIWPKRLKGFNPIGGLALPFPNNAHYACVRIFYPEGTLEQDEPDDDSEDVADVEDTEQSAPPAKLKKGEAAKLPKKAPKFLIPFGRAIPFIPFTKRGPIEAFIESPFKAALATSKGLRVIGVNGCHGCKEQGAELSADPTEPEARAWFKPELLPYLARGKPAELWTDADVLTNLNVRKAQLDFLDAAQALGAEARHRPIPAGGVDDYLAANTVGSLRQLPTHERDSKYVDVLRNPFRDLTEFGIADRFVALYGDDLRYDPSAGWFLWDGARWRTGKDAELAATEGVRATIETLKAEADAERNPEKLGARVRAMYEFQNQARMKAITTLIENTRAVRIDAATFDAEPNYLGVANGVLDISNPKKPALIEADRNVLVSKFAATRFNPITRAPMWEAFIAEATGHDKERTRLLYEIFGAALIGKAQRSEVVFIVGPAFSGKSVFLEAMHDVLGDYALATKADLLLRAGRHQNQDAERPSPFLAVLRGKRLAACGELQENTPIDDTILKDLTGGDTITARGLHKEPVTFRNTARVIVRANKSPMVTTTSEAAWSRILIVLFDVVIPEDQRDKDLCAKIVRDESAGVFNLALEGLARYAARGYRFEVPKDMRDVLNKHRVESDVLGTWLDESWVIDKTKREGPRQSAVTGDYMEWCKSNGHQPLGSIMLWKKLRERLGYDPVSRSDHGYKHALGFSALPRVDITKSSGKVVNINTAKKAKF